MMLRAPRNISHTVFESVKRRMMMMMPTHHVCDIIYKQSYLVVIRLVVRFLRNSSSSKMAKIRLHYFFFIHKKISDLRNDMKTKQYIILCYFLNIFLLVKKPVICNFAIIAIIL